MGSFDNIIGHESIKAELIKFADVIKNNEKYARMGAHIPSGVVLYGGPGVGKTLMARAFIEEAGCKTYTIRKDMPNGEFVKHIKETYEAAKNSAPSIVLLDDMDKFANEDEEHKNAEEYIAVQACIDDCKGMGIFSMATVNDMDCLPSSLLREGRFDKHIEVCTMMGDDGIRIIEHFLKQKQVSDDLDIAELALIMEGKSCAFLETVINEAGIYAGFRNKDKLDHDDIIKAFLRVNSNVSECLESYDYKNLHAVAVHEAGHAVVREVLNPQSVTLVSVYRREYSTEGIVRHRESPEYVYSIKLQEHNIIGTLGGKAASDVVFGTADTGCNSDLHSAFGKVEYLIDNMCSLGFDCFERGKSSEYLLSNKDRTISQEMDKYYQQAKKIIIKHRDFLDSVVDALLDHKTITYREMQAIREQRMKADS